MPHIVQFVSEYLFFIYNEKYQVSFHEVPPFTMTKLQAEYYYILKKYKHFERELQFQNTFSVFEATVNLRLFVNSGICLIFDGQIFPKIKNFSLYCIF